MKRAEVYLAGEEHHKHPFRLAEIELIKRFVTEGAISALSLELEYDKYQHLLDSYKPSDGHSLFEDITPIVYLAQKSHLDILASDYRDTLMGHIISELRKRDDDSGASDSEKEIAFLSDLKPLNFENPESLKADDSLYKSFNPNIASAQDIYDFLDIAYNEERERFTSHFLISYLKRKRGSRILHFGGMRHITGLKEWIEKAGHSVEVIDLLGFEKT